MISSFLKNNSQKVVWSRLFLLTPILAILFAFQFKEPAFSNAQIKEFDDSAFIESLQTDTDHVFISVEVLRSPPGGMDAFIQSVADHYVHPKEAKEAKVK